MVRRVGPRPGEVSELAQAVRHGRIIELKRLQRAFPGKFGGMLAETESGARLVCNAHEIAGALEHVGRTADAARFRSNAPERVRFPDGSLRWPALWVIQAGDRSMFEVFADLQADCWRLARGDVFDPEA